MRKSTFLYSIIVIWVVAVGSLVAIRYLLHKPSVTSGLSNETRSFFNSLDTDAKASISLYESGLIKLSDGTIRAIGARFEPELENLLSDHRISSRKIDFYIKDPLALERRMMAGEAFRTLNNAEKKCFVDGFGAIIFQNGDFRFFYDEAVYRDYVKKYGTECKSCEELKKSIDVQ